MADNYLEKRYDEVFGSGRKSSGSGVRLSGPFLETLLLKNRSFRGFDSSYKVHRLQLEAIVRVNTKLASGMNAQRLRFRLVDASSGSEKVLPLLKMGGALPELRLPLPGTEPEAFIVVCSTVLESPIVDIDLGISLQSMLLKAVELGLGGLIVRSFDKAALSSALDLPLEPIAVLAIGRPAEKIELVPVREGADLKYYRRDGVHYVPKIVAEDLMI